MTAQQLLCELQSVAPRDVLEWLDLRRAQIDALSDSDRAVVTYAANELKSWLSKEFRI